MWAFDGFLIISGLVESPGCLIISGLVGFGPGLLTLHFLIISG